MEASSSTHGQAARYDSLSPSAAQSPDLRLWNRVGSRPRPIICSCCEWLARDAAVEFQKRAIPPNRAPESRPEAPLGQKQKLNPLSLKKVLKLSQLLSPKPTKHDMASFGGTRSVSMPKTGCNWNDGTAEPTPSSGNRLRLFSGSRSLLFPSRHEPSVVSRSEQSHRKLSGITKRRNPWNRLDSKGFSLL